MSVLRMGSAPGAAARYAKLDPAEARQPRTMPSRGHHTEVARNERLAYLRRETATPLLALQEMDLNPGQLSANIENLIGAVEVPVGIAGPLTFVGKAVQGNVYLPMATTEGALVSSATRGALALSAAGGVTTRAINQRMSRAPMFMFRSLNDAFTFCDWLSARFEEVREVSERASRHARLLEIDSVILGRMVHVRFHYETADAAGQNMTTACTWAACNWIVERFRAESTGLERFIIESNMSSDKKVSARAFTEGRGTRAVAECFLPRAVVERYLKVTPEQLVADHEAALSGSIQNGSIGHNINVSNVVAAAFVATGQDVACVHESSLAQLAVQLVDDGVYASMLLPSLVVGTVGGGTHLPRQNELLGMMGCAGSGKVKRLAEILAGYCLALDLSTGAAVSGGQFVAAHEQLGRNRPVRAFGAADLTPAFFEPGVRRFLEDETIEMLDVETIDRHDSGGSILTALASIGTEKTIGLYPRRLSFRAKGRRTTIARDVMVKVKARDEDVTRLGLTCATMCGTALATAYAQSAKHLDHIGSHRRELALYENETDPRFRRHTPRIYGIHRDDARHGHVVVMELLPESALADRAGHSRWAREEILAAIDGIAAIHAISYGRSEELHAREWLGPARTVAQMSATLPLWQSLLDFAVTEHPEWFDARAEAEHRALLDMLPDWWRSLDALPKALVHNDFNPRNIALRGSPEGPRLCAFDWELAAILPPQHDLAELLANVLTPDVGRAELNTFIERHRLALEQESGVSINKDEWYRGVHLCTADLLVNRLGLYVMAHSARTLPFLERAIFTARHILRLTRPGAIDGVAA